MPRARLPKAQEPSQNTASTSQNDWFTVEGILKERSNDYLVKWEGIDDDTGRPFEPSWVSVLVPYLPFQQISSKYPRFLQDDNH